MLNTCLKDKNEYTWFFLMEVSHIYFIQEAYDGDDTIPEAFPQNEAEIVIPLKRALAADHMHMPTILQIALFYQ